MEFSFRTREAALARFRGDKFDLLVIGGGITGVAVARDAASRGLTVALVERGDYACGTSSASSKLIHGGLRYLENFELALVFEALSERSFLLKTAPNMVRPLPFYFPVYRGDAHGKGILRMGMWLYDLLALFRTPGFHRSLSARAMAAEIPGLNAEGLRGGFRYYDASMWDAELAVETIRAAASSGKVAAANYVEALEPLWEGKLISGFRVRECEPLAQGSREPIALHAKRTIVCAGPWTDELARRISPDWKPWLEPSKGVHLVFDLKRLPVPGALVMSHPDDGRISFVIPRPDFGAGVTIVGTTDSPVPQGPDSATIERADVDYLMKLLARYFPSLNLRTSDILSAYVGTRPLVGSGAESALQKVSREHHIDGGPGGTVLVAGGKYTTHRKMAEQVVDFALKHWREEARAGRGEPPPNGLGSSTTRTPVNPRATPAAMRAAEIAARAAGAAIPAELLARYGADAAEVRALAGGNGAGADPIGFPCLEGQLRHAIRNEMALSLEDFYLRRVPLQLTRADHGLPWAERLAKVWAEERGLGADAAERERGRLETELKRRDEWKTTL